MGGSKLGWGGPDNAEQGTEGAGEGGLRAQNTSFILCTLSVHPLALPSHQVSGHTDLRGGLPKRPLSICSVPGTVFI